MRIRALVLVQVFALLAMLGATPNAVAAPISDCKIATSPRELVSLGFPVLPERLRDKPKLLVIPFRLKDRPTYAFTQADRAEYTAAVTQIERLSGGKSKPELIFNEVIDIPDTVGDMITLRMNQQNSYNQDETISTWGFVRRIVSLSDQKIDFTGINGVILHGSSDSNQTGIAEAMMFQLNPTRQWFRPVETQEGKILNAVLMDKQYGSATIAHEILHLYGLTDLYGTQSGPGDASIMAMISADSLLNYEKWVLGWLPDTQVQCINEKTEIDKSKVSTRISIPTNINDQLVVIKNDKAGTALIIESVTIRTTKYIIFYSLDNDLRPPIELFFSPPRIAGNNSSITSFAGVGVQLNGPNYSLLVTDITSSEIVLDLIPKEQLSNATNLINLATANRSRIQANTNPVVSPVEVKPTPKPKQKTIICVQGKKTKKVVAAKPKCPKGFSQKK